MKRQRDFIKLLKHSREMLIFDDPDLAEFLAEATNAKEQIRQSPIKNCVSVTRTETESHYIAFVRFHGTADDGVIVLSMAKAFWAPLQARDQEDSFVDFCRSRHSWLSN